MNGMTCATLMHEDRWRADMRTLYVVALVAGLAPSVVSGQGADDWRTLFAAGEQAQLASDVVAYATEMSAAARAMPEGHLNRPFVQYHAARAAAMAGRAGDATRWLRQAWDEGIESLMISFAPYDPAFEDLRETADFRGVMALAADMVLTSRHLGGSVYLIEGAGANVVAQIGRDGVLLVDTGYGPALPALRSALAGIGGRGVDMLVVTHAHEDHMGATPELGAEATVLAHPQTTAQMREPYVFMEGVALPSKPEAALPDREVARDTTFRFNGETVRVAPTEAHTAGDLSVYFGASHIAHLGDTYLPGNPMMYAGREDPDGFLDRLEAFVDTLHPETLIVGGHGEPAAIPALREQIAQSRACMTLVREAIGEGLAIEATAERGADRFPPQWVAYFYQLLTRSGFSDLGFVRDRPALHELRDAMAGGLAREGVHSMDANVWLRFLPGDDGDPPPEDGTGS